MSVPVSRATLAAGCCAILVGALLLGVRHTAAETPRSDSTPTPAAKSRLKQKPFSASSFAALFRTTREQAKLRALDEADEFHRRDPELPAALGEAIAQALRTRQTTRSMFRAIRLLGELDQPKATDELVELLSSSDKRVVMLATEFLGKRQQPQTQEAVAQLTTHPEFRESYGFRQSVVRSVAQFATPESVDFLIDLLPRTEGQLQYETARQLSQLTGQNFGNYDENWKAWWQANRETVKILPLASPKADAVAPIDAPAAMPWKSKLPRFYDIPIYARRYIFVIDRSRSMLSSVDGVSRLERAKEELDKAIREMPEDTWFNIVTFDDRVTLWKPRLVPADRLHRAEAIRFAWSLDAGRRTACYDALEKAFGFDENLEAIFLLSDGRPTAGQLVDPDQITQAVTTPNFFRRVAINTLGIDARDEWQEFLKNLAELNYGEFKLLR